MARSYVARQSYYFDTSPTKVFAALTDPRFLVKWFLSDASLEPRKGGTFTFDWIGGYHMVGRVLAFDRGKAVSFEWTDRLPNRREAKTLAAFRVRRKGRSTLLELRHSGFKVPEHFAECASRWAYYLTNLKSVLDHGRDLRSRLDW